jgi:transposase-like protein
MKGKNYTTEDKIRILREADTGKSVLEVCREHNIKEGQLSALEAALRADGDQ